MVADRMTAATVPPRPMLAADRTPPSRCATLPPPCPAARATTSATSPSSPTSITARPRSSTRCSARPGVPREPGGRRPRDGLEGPRAREGHHDPRQADTVDYGDVRLNIVDTPGHADFGGEVERALLMVDSVLLLVDAAEGPLPQTRYVLQKAMARHLPVVVALNKIDRSDARPAEVLDDVYELFIDLGADDAQIDFPIVYTNAKAGTATTSTRRPGRGPPSAARPAGRCHAAADLHPGPPAPAAGHEPGGQRLRRPDGRRAPVERDDPRWASASPSCARRPTTRRVPSSPADRDAQRDGDELQTARGIERVDIAEAGPGRHRQRRRAARGHDRRHVTEPDDPRPLPRLDVDAPTLRMTFGVNTSPLAGREGAT